MPKDTIPPILRYKSHAATSVFQPENLVREARAQKGLAVAEVPPLCVLDPDGDIVRHLQQTDDGALSSSWACYHSEMHLIQRGGTAIGIVGCAVGAPYAVLVAEQAFACGAKARGQHHLSRPARTAWPDTLFRAGRTSLAG